MSRPRDGEGDSSGAQRATRIPVSGFHHVTAVGGDPQENVDFYTEVLGLRLVKRTVNFEDKFTYHLYYGDRTGSPGTLLTFFAYPGLDEGRVGRPQPSATALSIPADSVEYWHDRLEAHGVTVEDPLERFGQPVLRFRDHDGTSLELVATNSFPSRVDPATGSVPAEHAIRGLHSVTLLSASVFHTAATLEVLGLELVEQEGERVRYRGTADTSDSLVVDLLDTDAPYGRDGIGTTHHVAFRVGERSLEAWHDRLLEAGADPSRIKDRHYFESLYVREPGGLLFELATDLPGVTVDEPVSDLGSRLSLPPALEVDREMLEEQLPELSTGE